MSPQPRPASGLPFFTFPPSLTPLSIPAKAFLSTRPLLAGAATGALVFSRAAEDDAQARVLLLQRAPHDSMPLRWEIPGGACDPEDETLFHGLARELWEEAGLRLKRVVRQVGGEQVFLTSRGLAVAKVSFEVEVDETSDDVVNEERGGLVDGEDQGLPEVVLDPNEHVRFLWATEQECRARRAVVRDREGREEVVEVVFTTEDQRKVVLEGFEARREAEGRGVGGAAGG
ncbi:hypothetical protein VTI74DRAFT_8900 [Chaetomium olivicolor]